MRGLTEAELDELAAFLTGATDVLRQYDEAVGNRLTRIAPLEDSWWPELRPELLRRGITAQALGDCVRSIAGSEFYFREEGPPRWLAPLIVEVAGRVDPSPLAARINAHIRALTRLPFAKLDAGLRVACCLHPFGGPHQVEFNLAELWGMKPIARTDDGATVVGYGEEGPPQKLPWETGAVKPRISERRAEGPGERFWLPVYEGLLSWIAGERVKRLYRYPAPSEAPARRVANHRLANSMSASP
jgi:hypothetical protein